MAETVVVELEPVEVEHRQRQRGLLRCERDQLVEVLHEAPAVAEPREGVGDRVALGALEQPLVRAQRQREPAHDRQKGDRGERGGRRMRRAEALRREDAHCHEREQGGRDQFASSTRIGGECARAALPGCPCEQHQRGGPEGVDHRGRHVVEGGCAVQEDAIRDRCKSEAAAYQEQRPVRAPAGYRERADPKTEKQQITERVGQVHRHGHGVAVGDGERGLEQDADAERRNCKGADRAVEPDAERHATHARAHEQDQPRVCGGVEDQEERVARGEGRELLEVRERDGPVHLAGEPADERHRERDPGGALVPHEHHARDADRGGAADQRVVDPVVEEPGARGISGEEEMERISEQAQRPQDARRCASDSDNTLHVRRFGTERVNTESTGRLSDISARR